MAPASLFATSDVLDPAINVRAPDLVFTAAQSRRNKVAVPSPVLLIEILSASNARDTRGNVFGYKAIPSVAEIVVVDGARVFIEVWRRAPDGEWAETEALRPGDRLRLGSVALDVAAEDVYSNTWLLSDEPGID